MDPKAQSSAGKNDADVKLLQAVGSFRVDDVRALLRQGAAVDARTPEGKTALHLLMQAKNYGAESGNGREILAIFLNRGLDINTPDPKGVTPLHLAVLDEAYSTTRYRIEDLLNFGADLQACDNQGQTPLHFAATVRSGAALKILIERGADINALDDIKRAPLHFAAMRGDADMIKALLAAGAQANLKSVSGKYPWHYAEETGYDYLAQMLRAEAQKQRHEEEKAKAVAEPWSLLGPDRVSQTTVEKKIGYRLTEIFNFGARTYTQIARNLQSGAEGVTVKSFDEFSDKSLLEHAHDNLIRLGGDAERGLIHHRNIDKPRQARFKKQ